MPRKALRVRRPARGFALSASNGEVGASLAAIELVRTIEGVASSKRTVSDLIPNGLRRCEWRWMEIIRTRLAFIDTQVHSSLPFKVFPVALHLRAGRLEGAFRA